MLNFHMKSHIAFIEELLTEMDFTFFSLSSQYYEEITKPERHITAIPVWSETLWGDCIIQYET